MQGSKVVTICLIFGIGFALSLPASGALKRERDDSMSLGLQMAKRMIIQRQVKTSPSLGFQVSEKVAKRYRRLRAAKAKNSAAKN